ETHFDSFKTPVIISDRDEMNSIARKTKKEYINKKIRSKLEKVIESRTLEYVDESETVEITANNEQEITSYCIAPVIANGDPIGCVLIFSKEDTFSNVEEKAAETAAIFLGKQME